MATETNIPPLTVSNPWWGHDPSDKQRLFHASLSVTLHAADQDGLKELTQKARSRGVVKFS